MKQKFYDGMITLRRYWQKPKKGCCVPYKEIVSFSVGGMGVKSIQGILSWIYLQSTCLLIGSIYGLAPRNIMYLFIITNVIGVIKTPLISMLVDNTKTKIGKFRPYLLWAGLPSVLSIIALTWFVPMGGSMITKTVLIGIFINVLSIAQPLHLNAYMGISQVMTPNSGERTAIMSVSEFLGNLGPSILSFLFPTLATLFFGKEGTLDIWAYRTILPVFAILGFFLGFLIMYNNKERVIKPMNKSDKVKFWTGVKQISRNRTFWIVTFSKFFDGFKQILTLLLGWIFVYQLGDISAQGIVTALVATAFIPGMLLAPLLKSKLGPRKAGFLAHILNCLAALVMLFTFKKGIAFFAISLFLYNFAMGPQYVIQTSIMSDGFDYQQDRDSVRIEGFAQNFMLMFITIGTIVSTVVFTAIYESNGLVADAVTGLTDYNILRDAAVREPIISTVIIVVLIASLLSALPYLFCNLNKEKMKAIRESLEKKKFIADNNLEEESEEVIAEKYSIHLAELEKEEVLLAAKLEEEKRVAKEKQLANAEKKQQIIDERNAVADQMRADGKSNREVKQYLKGEIKKEKAEINEKRKAYFAELTTARKALNERKKAFVKQEIADMKARGEKKYVHILAREKFYEMLWEEENAESVKAE